MYEIEQIIKHRKPMRLIDELHSFDEKSASVLVHVSSNCEFYDSEKQGVPSYIGIEYMAQCIAAKAGINELESGEQPKLGFLLGTRKYKPNVAYFSTGNTLIVKATQLLEDAEGLSVFECSIVTTCQADRVLAKAKINVFQPKDSQAYLQ